MKGQKKKEIPVCVFLRINMIIDRVNLREVFKGTTVKHNKMNESGSLDSIMHNSMKQGGNFNKTSACLIN